MRSFECVVCCRVILEYCWLTCFQNARLDATISSIVLISYNPRNSNVLIEAEIEGVICFFK